MITLFIYIHIKILQLYIKFYFTLKSMIYLLYLHPLAVVVAGGRDSRAQLGISACDWWSSSSNQSRPVNWFAGQFGPFLWLK